MSGPEGSAAPRASGGARPGRAGGDTVAEAWLAIDTATDLASVALTTPAGILHERSWHSRRRHTVELAPTVDRMLAREGLAPSGLAGIAVALGPGSYTGLRIGLSLAKGLALGGGSPVLGVPTLDVLAAALAPAVVGPRPPLWAVLQAGRGRVVAARYPAGPGESAPDPRALEVWTVESLVAALEPPCWVAGELDPAARALLAARAGAEEGLRVLPPEAGLRRAAWLARLGREALAAQGPADLAALSPIYLGGAPAP